MSQKEREREVFVKEVCNVSFRKSVVKSIAPFRFLFVINKQNKKTKKTKKEKEKKNIKSKIW